MPIFVHTGAIGVFPEDSVRLFGTMLRIFSGKSYLCTYENNSTHLSRMRTVLRRRRACAADAAFGRGAYRRQQGVDDPRGLRFQQPAAGRLPRRLRPGAGQQGEAGRHEDARRAFLRPADSGREGVDARFRRRQGGDQGGLRFAFHPSEDTRPPRHRHPRNPRPRLDRHACDRGVASG